MQSPIAGGFQRRASSHENQKLPCSHKDHDPAYDGKYLNFNSRSTSANPSRFIATQNTPDNLLLAIDASFYATVNEVRDMRGDIPVKRDAPVKPTGNWARFTEKMKSTLRNETSSMQLTNFRVKQWECTLRIWILHCGKIPHVFNRNRSLPGTGLQRCDRPK